MNQNRLRRLTASSAVCAFALACSQDEELAAPSLEPPVEHGGVCRTSSAHCLSESSILYCEGHVWTERACDTVCGSTGRTALGCYDRAFGDECLCAAPEGDAASSNACAAPTHCSGPETLVYCDQSGLRQQSCADLCAELEPPRRSAGCRPKAAFEAVDDCVCTFAGTPCETELDAVCDGASHLARCVDGAWVLEDCAARCAPEERASCSSWAGDAGAACRCEPAP